MHHVRPRSAARGYSGTEGIWYNIREMDAVTGKLAEDVKAKILANAEVVERAQGSIQISIHRKGKGNEVKLGVTL